MHARDRRTDRQTDGQTGGQNYDSQHRPRICSRGKNVCQWLSVSRTMSNIYNYADDDDGVDDDDDDD